MESGEPQIPNMKNVLAVTGSGTKNLAIIDSRQVGVRPAAARLALGVEMEGWKLNKARGPCLLA